MMSSFSYYTLAAFYVKDINIRPIKAPGILSSPVRPGKKIGSDLLVSFVLSSLAVCLFAD